MQRWKGGKWSNLQSLKSPSGKSIEVSNRMNPKYHKIRCCLLFSHSNNLVIEIDILKNFSNQLLSKEKLIFTQYFFPKKM